MKEFQYTNRQNMIYILLSFLLSIILTTYYVKQWNLKFIFILILLFCIFYAFFYIINLEENNEKFMNYYDGKNDVVSSDLDYFTQKHQEHKKSVSEEESSIVYHKSTVKPKTHLQEKSSKSPVQEEEQPTPSDKTSSSLSGMNIQDLEKLLLLNSLKGTPACSPVNININYPGDNTVNGVPIQQTQGNQCNHKNLGDYKSRVYNNSDWIYGTMAWTKSPDFYIPNENSDFLLPNFRPHQEVTDVSQKVNELLLKYKFQGDDKNVCPMMINTPWSEYLSGDN